MEKMLIIGNGFDLAHELPTKYIDFLKFMKMIEILGSKENTELEKAIKDMVIEPLNLHPEIKEIIINSKSLKTRKRLLELSYENSWIKYFKKKNFGNDVKKKTFGNDGWIDFELEISKVIKSLEELIEYTINSKYQKKTKDLDLELNRIISKFNTIVKLYDKNEELISNKELIINKLNTDLDNLIRCLEIYLVEYVQKIKINKHSPNMENNFDKILSFNYTNTYEKTYAKSAIEYDFIHGKASEGESNNMVLGIDEYLPAEGKNNKLDFIQFKKYFQRIYKKTGCKYKDWLADIGEVYIFGHSLDITDKDIFYEILMKEGIKTTIYYFNEKDYAQKIANVVKIIGQDELIKKVYGLGRTIIFEKQDDMI